VYGEPEFLFFDEIQNIPMWESFVNRLHREGRKLIITGSNSNLLCAELSTHLTGRHTQTTIFPFSFGEYLTATREENTEIQKHELLRKYAETAAFIALPPQTLRYRQPTYERKGTGLFVQVS